jgi:L-fuconolactonase
VIDAHHHLWPAEAIPDQDWRPADDAAIDRAFEGDEFAALRSAAGVRGSVLMQSVDAEPENARLLDYAAADPGIRGIVAWAPLPAPAEARGVIERTLDAAERRGLRDRVVGVRCLVGRADLDWVTDRVGVALFRELAERGLAWDIVPLTDGQRDAVRRLADAVPQLRIVIDHLAAPPPEGGLEEWATGLRSLAEGERVAVKLSIGVAVLQAMREWDARRLAELHAVAIDAFGPARSMLASNWPVVELRADYATAWRDGVAAVSSVVAADDLERVCSGTAMEWYGMNGSTA